MRWLILAPMNIEEQYIQKALDERKGMLRHSYKVMQCGVGKVEAACTLSCELTLADYNAVAVVGYAAGSKGEILGNVVAPKWARYHDCVVPEALHEMLPALVDPYPLAYGKDEMTVYTGDAFVDAALSEKIRVDHGGDACFFDMEATALAQVCKHFDVPFSVVKMISDVPEDGSDADAFMRFVETHTDFSALVDHLESVEE